jgi:Reverse transcriptase (RNA-dependent DNA polymerase)
MRKLSNLVGFFAPRTMVCGRQDFAPKGSPNDGGGGGGWEDCNETFAPVTKYISIRTLFAILAGRKAKIHQMDVNTAFLYSLLKEIVYVEQAERFISPGKENFVCFLQKALYRLKQSTVPGFTLLQRFSSILISNCLNQIRASEFTEMRRDSAFTSPCMSMTSSQLETTRPKSP